MARDLLLRVWRCPEVEFDAEAFARGLVRAASAVDAAKRLVPGFWEETEKRAEAAHGGR
ncbi:hypothetical protein ACFYO5_11150 [Streptomyces sp. NPDC006259]|uniref:hypothetical protein n=1 Tax=Streptomyces sp. NPDC006259 TaxID=3364740 RepID=UPI0036ABCF67